MNIRPLTKNDINKCAELYIKSYNQPPWNYNFTLEKAIKYLTEYVDSQRFVGFVLCEEDNIAGAVLGHSKTWWTNDLLFVDEVFISPERQRLGYGKFLLDHTENFAREKGYEVITLMTNKYMPAMKFYNGIDYLQAEHFVFLFKPI
ncbi:MAG: family N-acetyltransferase [Mucilaginibacter sp.]|nr:family N-acetyltransferase [Mucilaginibacter sp.]